MIDNNVEQENWTAIVLASSDKKISDELNKELPDKAMLSNWLKAKFILQNADTVRVSQEVAEQLYLRWLHFQRDNSDLQIFWRKYPRLQALVSLTFSDKVNSIAQRNCQICNPVDADDDPFPIYNIPLRIRGRSRQSITPQEFSNYQSAIRRRLNRNGTVRKTFHAYCLTLTFVMKKSNRDRDIDNMTKTLMDATSRALGFNDSKVHHLNAVKLIFPECEEHVFVRLAPSFLNSHQDVLIAKQNLSWADAEPLT